MTIPAPYYRDDDNGIVPSGDVVVAEAEALLRAQDTGSVKLIIADPPYGIGYHSNHYVDKNPHAPISQDWNFQISSFLSESGRVLADGGALYLFCRYDVCPLWVPYIQASGLKLKTVIVWVKDNWSAGDLDGCFGNQYEQILFCSKGRHLLRGKRWSNVWQFPRVPARSLFHPAQKPTALLQRAIESSSDEGDVVVDPFCGSGSTGEAATASGRRFLLGDIDKKMVSLSRRRLGLPVDDEQPPPLESQPQVIDIPNPEEWGLHPEEMRFLFDELNGAIEQNIAAERLRKEKERTVLFDRPRRKQRQLELTECRPATT